MYPIHIFLVIVTLYLGVAQAELFVVQPLEGSTCEADKPCTITWVDNGVRPLLSSIGLSTVGLYTGRQQLVQTIPAVDVSTEHSVTFNPNPSAGPNSDTYYIAITSTTLKGNDSIPYSGWSSFFTLTGMNGSFDTPLPSATSSIPIPSTIVTSDGVGTSTRTIGATSTTTIATTTSSRIITSVRPTSSALSSSKSTLARSSSALTTSSLISTFAPTSTPSTTATTSTSVSTSTSTLVSISSTSTVPVASGTAAEAVTTPAVSSASTGSASRSVLVLTVVASIIYSTLS